MWNHCNNNGNPNETLDIVETQLNNEKPFINGKFIN